jgi:uncharacterized iron-regulated membrane protein
VLFVIIAGGLPWTDMFGKNFKSLQKATDSGYPSTWFSSRGLNSTVSGLPMNIDEISEHVSALNLSGKVRITLPTNETSVISITNTAERLRDQKSIHLDQYTGSVVKQHNWDEVGAMAAGRQVVMRLHMGEFFGWANFIIILLTASALAVLSVVILVAYIMRKPQGKLGLPSVPSRFKLQWPLAVVVIGLAFLLPMFGYSLLVILSLNGIKAAFSFKKRQNKMA